VPRRMANFIGHWRGEYLHWYLGAKWVADRERGPSDPRPPIDDYLWLNSRLELGLKDWTLGLAIYNLSDEDAREPSNGYVSGDYPLAGQQWLLDVTYDFDH
jgi:outer membrane receptor protein involved in Fe transport